MALANVVIGNTFDEWRVRTNQLISGLANLDEGRVPIVSNVANASFVTANSAVLIGNTAFNKANSANIIAASAFIAANAVTLIANTAYDKANAANVLAFSGSATAVAAFTKANSANIIASVAYDKANSANIISSTAYDKANSANIIASVAYDKANAANIIAVAAFTAANSGIETGSIIYFAGNTSSYVNTTNWLPAEGGTVLQASYPTLYSKIGLIASVSPENISATQNTDPSVDPIGTTAIFGIDVAANTADANARVYIIGTSDTSMPYCSSNGRFRGLTQSSVTKPRAVAFGNNRFLFCNVDAGTLVITKSFDNAQTWRSTDSANVNFSFSGTEYRAKIIYAAANDVFVLIVGLGNSSRTSTSNSFISNSSTGNTWIKREYTGMTSNTLHSIAHGNGTYVAVGGNNAALIVTSFDANTWTVRDTSMISSNIITSVVWANNQFVATTNDPYIHRTSGFTNLNSEYDTRQLLSSSNGITWTVVSNNSPGKIVAYHEGIHYFSNMNRPLVACRDINDPSTYYEVPLETRRVFSTIEDNYSYKMNYGYGFYPYFYASTVDGNGDLILTGPEHDSSEKIYDSSIGPYETEGTTIKITGLSYDSSTSFALPDLRQNKFSPDQSITNEPTARNTKPFIRT